MNLAKTEARQTFESLSFLEGRRVHMVEKIANGFLIDDCVVDDVFVMLMNGDDVINEAVNQ